MDSKMKTIRYKLIIIIGLLLNVALIIAQPGPVNPGGAPSGPALGAGVPLDEGSLGLLLAGIAYIGFSKYKKLFKSKIKYDKNTKS
jgi:membrane protease YdiL (CAAX protease family)